MKSFLRDLQRLPEILRWRNPRYLLLLLTREIFRPFIYWYVFDIFERHLRRPMPAPYSKETFEVRIFEGNKDLERAVEDLRSLDNLSPAEIEMRLERGDVVAVAHAAGQSIGCMWLTFSSGMELAFGISWLIGPFEALRYGAFVLPAWRGRAVHSVVNDAINRYARNRGIVCTLAGISALNSQSSNLPRHLRNSRVMRVVLVHLRGVNWTYRKAIGAPLESRFSIAPGPNGSILRQSSGGYRHLKSP